MKAHLTENGWRVLQRKLNSHVSVTKMPKRAREEINVVEHARQTKTVNFLILIN